ncbi:MAG: hypothetical protein JW981_01055 [Anaerolineae bacterium]|nr:hypothetical protein [Anaerolineae bacterium]
MSSKLQQPVARNLVFAFMAVPGMSEAEAVTLADSIRTFAGKLSQNPIWVLVPKMDKALDKKTIKALRALDAQIISFDIEPAALEFPLAAKAFAAAEAESQAQGYARILTWMDTDVLVFNPPTPLLLEQGMALGYRPVDHTLIGSLYDKPLDAFWSLIYAECRVPEEKIFPMLTSVDRNRLRPYFNAGILVVRPEYRVLRTWRDNFQRLYRDARFETFYEEHVLYRIFMHQAVLSGTILSLLDASELQLLPHRINYPLNLHHEYPEGSRPDYINTLISCRYDTLFQDEKWPQVFQIQEPVKSWLQLQPVITKNI